MSQLALPFPTGAHGITPAKQCWGPRAGAPEVRASHRTITQDGE